MNKVLLTNVETAGNDLPATHDTFCRKKYVKPVSGKVQAPSLLHERHAALGLLHRFSFGSRRDLSLRPLG